ncbi:MAG: pyridoxal phosphate-dependent aminotransferase [Planctomycetota bacterium]
MDVADLVADRMSLIDSSGIRKVFDLAKSIPDPINLSIGQPDFDVPDAVKSSAIQAIEGGQNQYTVTQGTAALRKAVLDRERSAWGLNHDSVLITSGVSGGLLLALMALINDGDCVAIPDPYFVMYKHLSRLVGGEPFYVDTYPDFTLTAERLEKTGASKAKLLLFNSPNNPTGQVVPPGELQKIAQWAEHNDVFIITDDIYSVFTYDAPFTSIASYSDNVLLLNGFSKSDAMTGWRLGYAIGPDELIDEMIKLQQFSFVCAPSIAQEAGITALQRDKSEYVKNYRRKRDIIYQGLSGKFEMPQSKGAFYAFIKAPDGDGDAFAEEAIDNGCLIIPGSVFSERRTHFRVSFAAPDETLHRGVELLCSLV